MKSTTNVSKTANVLKSCLAITSLALVLAGNLAMAASRNPNQGIVKPDGHYRGDSYGEREAQWWQIMYSIPVVNSTHPLLTGGAVISNNVAYLSPAPGSSTPTTTTIDVTIPSGTAVFIPVINAECSTIEPDPFHGDTQLQMSVCANGHIDKTSGLSASIDSTPVNSLETYRVQSPLFEFTLPEDNVLQFQGIPAPAGTTAQAVDAGVYLLLNPLSPGGHTIRVRGTFDEFGTTIDTMFRITVQ